MAAMNFEFLSNIPWFGTCAKNDRGTTFMSTTAVLETPKQGAHFDIKLWGWSVLSVVPWFLNKRENIQGPSKVKKEWKKPARPSSFVDSSVRNSGIRFRPYVSKVPWHTGRPERVSFSVIPSIRALLWTQLVKWERWRISFVGQASN